MYQKLSDTTTAYLAAIALKYLCLSSGQDFRLYCSRLGSRSNGCCLFIVWYGSGIQELNAVARFCGKK